MDYKLEDLVPVIEFGQEYKDAVFALCERFYLTGRYEDAGTLAFELRRINPLDVRVYKLSAAIWASQEQYGLAYSSYHAGLDIAPNDAELWVGMGQSAIYLDQYSEAIKCLDKTMVLAKKDKELYEHARKLRNLIQ